MLTVDFLIVGRVGFEELQWRKKPSPSTTAADDRSATFFSILSFSLYGSPRSRKIAHAAPWREFFKKI